jgi:hypothetical protein
MRSHLFGLHGGDQLRDQAHVGVVYHLLIGVAVQRRQMDYGIALPDEGAQFGLVGEKGVLAGDALELLRHRAQQVEKVSPDESGLTGYADFYHFISLQSNQ